MCGLTGAILGSIAALILGASTLMMRDFYRPYFNRSGDDRKDLAFLRIATFVAGVLPILLALYASNVLAVTFLAKSLRASLAVLVVMMFFKPGYGSRKAAMWSIILAVPATIGWFLAGDPFGVDNAYIAVATPLVVMTIGHLLRSGQSDTAPALAAEAPARARDGQLIRE
jgi:SSS family solute:Na+ symporter